MLNIKKILILLSVFMAFSMMMISPALAYCEFNHEFVTIFDKTSFYPTIFDKYGHPQSPNFSYHGVILTRDGWFLT